MQRKPNVRRALVVALASAVTLAACGSDGASESLGGSADAPRTIEVAMTDLAFTPSGLDVTVGETVNFVFRNDGAVRHEAVFGTLAEQEAHEVDMAEMSGAHGEMDEESAPNEGEMGMTDLDSVVVEPGATVEITQTFDAAGTTMIGCHEPGHWEAGMKMNIEVS